MSLWVSCNVTKPDYIKGKTVDTKMSPASTPGPDLRPNPRAEAGEEGKSRWRGGGEEGPGAGVRGQASKIIRSACCQGQGFLLCCDSTERAIGLSKASLRLPLWVHSVEEHMLMGISQL